MTKAAAQDQTEPIVDEVDIFGDEFGELAIGLDGSETEQIAQSLDTSETEQLAQSLDASETEAITGAAGDEADDLLLFEETEEEGPAGHTDEHWEEYIQC